jgi:hypothetical protein
MPHLSVSYEEAAGIAERGAQDHKRQAAERATPSCRTGQPRNMTAHTAEDTLARARETVLQAANEQLKAAAPSPTPAARQRPPELEATKDRPRFALLLAGTSRREQQ